MVRSDACLLLIPLGPHYRFGDTLGQIPRDFSTKRECGAEEVNGGNIKYCRSPGENASKRTVLENPEFLDAPYVQDHPA